MKLVLSLILTQFLFSCSHNPQALRKVASDLDEKSHEKSFVFNQPRLDKVIKGIDGDGPFPIVYSERNARTFCVMHGFDDFEQESLKSESFVASGINGTSVAVKNIAFESEMAKISQTNIFRGNVLSSVTCLRRSE